MAGVVAIVGTVACKMTVAALARLISVLDACSDRRFIMTPNVAMD